LYANDSLRLAVSAWTWPLEHYSLVNRVPYAYQNWSDATRESFFNVPAPQLLLTVVTLSPLWIVPTLPLLSIGLLAYWVGRMRRDAASFARGAYYVLINSAIVGLLVSIVIVRPDIVHFMYLLPIFGIALAWIFDGSDIPGQVFRRLRPLITAYIVIAFAFMSLSLLLRSVPGVSSSDTARGEIHTAGKDTVIGYTATHVAPGEAVLIHPYLPLYYYFTDTRSPGRYEYLQPGLHTAEQVGEMLQSVSSIKPRAALLELSFLAKIPASWPNTPVGAIVKDPVSDYILENYRACKVLHSPQLWRFLFMIRKDLSCPEL
jgi:hypothetical protein